MSAGIRRLKELCHELSTRRAFKVDFGTQVGRRRDRVVDEFPTPATWVAEVSRGRHLAISRLWSRSRLSTVQGSRSQKLYARTWSPMLKRCLPRYGIRAGLV